MILNEIISSFGIYLFFWGGRGYLVPHNTSPPHQSKCSQHYMQTFSQSGNDDSDAVDDAEIEMLTMDDVTTLLLLGATTVTAALAAKTLKIYNKRYVSRAMA